LVSEELLVSRIEREFAIMTEERMQLHRQLDEMLEEKRVLESSLRDLTGQLVEGLLEDRVVGVILSSDFDENEGLAVTTAVEELLRAAGAEVQAFDPEAPPADRRQSDVKLLVYPEGAGTADGVLAGLFPNLVLGQWGSGNAVTMSIGDHAPVVPGVGRAQGNVTLVRTLAKSLREDPEEIPGGGISPPVTNK